MPSPLGPFLGVWERRVGLIAPGRAAKALSPAVKAYGGERVLKALENYLDNPHIKVRRLEYFVQDIVRYLPSSEPPQPLVDETGELTEAGVRAYYGRP